MNRYFFHCDYGATARDTDGTVLPNLAAAREAAVHMLGEILRDQGDAFWAKPDLTLTVTDANDLILWTLSVSGVQSACAAAERPPLLTHG